MTAYLLDTDIITTILKRNEDGAELKAKIQGILQKNDYILLSPVVFYEIARGLYHKGAKEHFSFFKKLAGEFEWLDLTRNTWDAGAKLWAECRKKGTLTGAGIDKDVLIAAQAKEHDAIVVTRNERHFQYLGVAHVTW